MHRTLIVVPARMHSTRLPGKPLIDIAGEPMIVHVWRRAVAAARGRVVVATDAEAIAEAVRRVGGEAVMTRADHVSGSDRVFEAACRVDPKGDFEIILNLQGDLPAMEAGIIGTCLAPLEDAAPHIATIAAEITDPADRTNPNSVKVVGTPTAVPGIIRVSTNSAGNSKPSTSRPAIRIMQPILSSISPKKALMSPRAAHA